jgi:hypothetical protein
MLQAAQASPLRYCVKVPVVVVDDRDAHRDENERLAAGENPGQVRLRNWRGPSSGHDNMNVTERARLVSPLLSGAARVVLPEPDAVLSYDEETGTVRDDRTGLGLRVRPEGDRDYYYDVGTVLRGEDPVAELSLHTRDCWRPAYGPSQLVHLNRATGEELPLEVLVPMLNRHPRLFGNGEHLGHAVVVDTRAEPVGYYYG